MTRLKILRAGCVSVMIMRRETCYFQVHDPIESIGNIMIIVEVTKFYFYREVVLQQLSLLKYFSPCFRALLRIIVRQQVETVGVISLSHRMGVPIYRHIWKGGGTVLIKRAIKLHVTRK